MPALTKDEFRHAIADGIAEGFYNVVCNATSMPSHDFFDSIKDAVHEAYAISQEFGLFIECAAVAGARTSQLARPHPIRRAASPRTAADDAALE